MSAGTFRYFHGVACLLNVHVFDVVIFQELLLLVQIFIECLFTITNLVEGVVVLLAHASRGHNLAFRARLTVREGIGVVVEKLVERRKAARRRRIMLIDDRVQQGR